MRSNSRELHADNIDVVETSLLFFFLVFISYYIVARGFRISRLGLIFQLNKYMYSTMIEMIHKNPDKELTRVNSECWRKVYTDNTCIGGNPLNTYIISFYLECIKQVKSI